MGLTRLVHCWWEPVPPNIKELQAHVSPSLMHAAMRLMLWRCYHHTIQQSLIQEQGNCVYNQDIVWGPAVAKG